MHAKIVPVRADTIGYRDIWAGVGTCEKFSAQDWAPGTVPVQEACSCTAPTMQPSYKLAPLQLRRLPSPSWTLLLQFALSFCPTRSWGLKRDPGCFGMQEAKVIGGLNRALLTVTKAVDGPAKVKNLACHNLCARAVGNFCW